MEVNKALVKFCVALMELQEQHVDEVGFGTTIVGCLFSMVAWPCIACCLLAPIVVN